MSWPASSRSRDGRSGYQQSGARSASPVLSHYGRDDQDAPRDEKRSYDGNGEPES